MNMKKCVLLFVLFLKMISMAYSQIGHSVSIGPDLGIGANFGKASKLSLGASFNYTLHLSDKVGIRLHAGYNRFNANIPGDYVSFLPLRAGLQAFVYKDIFFVFAEGGVTTFNDSTPEDPLSKFSWAAGLGRNIPLDEKGKSFIQVSACFNFYKHRQYSNYTWFNLRAAYGLSWGKKKIQEKN
jgi:hypothetical protein